MSVDDRAADHLAALDSGALNAVMTAGAPGGLYRPPMPDEPVLTERRDGVLLITLNRPEARNAVNLALAEGVAAALDELDADGDVAVGIITGAGAGFCAGMDLKAFVTGERPWVGDRGFAGIVQRSARKPLIAAIEGFAVAGGLEVALACDLIVAAREARLGIPEVKRSLVAAAGALRRLPQRLPYGVAMELALTGEPITAERGYELGLVNRLADRGGAVDAALELARAIAGNGPLALDATKAVLQQQFDWSEEEFWRRQGELVAPVMSSQDAREGAVAFSEKRDPVWQGR
jgi:enoyl-CoA hydratase